MRFLQTVVIILFSINLSMSQEIEIRTLDELIDNKDSGWVMLKEWIEEAKNKVEVLDKDNSRADSTLYQLQVTTRSTMGAIVYETGGLFIDNGWIRVLGSGSDRLGRTITNWNLGKSYEKFGQVPEVLLIADDIMGGFFAINGGVFGKETFGKIYYFAPDNLEWECLNMGYTDFIKWLLNGDVNQFYEGYKWTDWEKDILKLNGDEVISFFPYLFTQYDDYNKLSRKTIPIEESWNFQLDMWTQIRK